MLKLIVLKITQKCIKIDDFGKCCKMTPKSLTLRKLVQIQYNSRFWKPGKTAKIEDWKNASKWPQNLKFTKNNKIPKFQGLEKNIQKCTKIGDLKNSPRWNKNGTFYKITIRIPWNSESWKTTPIQYEIEHLGKSCNECQNPTFFKNSLNKSRIQGLKNT